MTALTDPERAILLRRCECGHSINYHGSLEACWLCGEDNLTCARDFEALLCARVGEIVDGRLSEGTGA